MNPENTPDTPKKTNNFLKNGKTFLRKNPVTKNIIEHKILIASLMLSILLWPKTKEGLNKYLERKHSESLVQMDKDFETKMKNGKIEAERKIRQRKKDEAIALKKKEIADYDASLKILREGRNYGYATIRKRWITREKALDMQKNIIEEAERLLPIMRKLREEAVLELKAIQNTPI